MTASNQGTSFSAADSTLGYLYQVRLALLWSLQRLKSGSEFIVSVETLDDIAFEYSGSPVELLQTKHHRNRQASLTDSCPDLWKSLRIWFEGVAGGYISSSANLYLITTGTAPIGSAASKLRSSSRDVDAALAALTPIAQTAGNQANGPAYAAFLKSSLQDRKAILSMITVIDRSSHISDLDRDLKAEVFWASERKLLTAFLARLEGWWFQRILCQLVAAPAEGKIHSAELESEMSDLREQFKQDSLPIDTDLLDFTADEITQNAHSNSTFVHQLQMIQASKQRIVSAVRDYYRAFEQRSRWVRNDLLLVGEMDKYEKRLIEEWELTFAAMTDELGTGVVDDVKKRAARKVLEWAEHAIYPIRPGVTEPFVTRGSFHMLADEIRIGWHPDFKSRLAVLLGAKEVKREALV